MYLQEILVVNYVNWLRVRKKQGVKNGKGRDLIENLGTSTRM